MNRQGLGRLFFGMAIAVVSVLILLAVMGRQLPVSAQSEVTPNLTPTVAPVESGSVATTPTTSPQGSDEDNNASSKSAAILDSVLYTTLLEQSENISNKVLDITKWVIVIIGGIGGIGGSLAGFLGFRKLSDITKTTTDLEDRWKDLKSEMESMRSKINEERTLYEARIGRLQYSLEAKDVNPEVRVRAAQKLGVSNDIAAISTLIDLLIGEDEDSEDVRIEAAYGLGQLLKLGAEARSLENGVEALLKGTNDDVDKVRVESVEALEGLVLSNVDLPRTVYRRMQELVKRDTIEDVRKAAEETLRHIKRQRDNMLDSSSQNPSGGGTA